MKTYLFSLYLLLVAFSPAAAQDMRISGTVTTIPGGQPLGGVTVQEKNAAAHTSTDAAGHYNLILSRKPAVLEFRLQGYHTRTVTAGRADTVINLQLETRAQTAPEAEAAAAPAQLKMRQHTIAAVMPAMDRSGYGLIRPPFEGYPPFHTEEYDAITENRFVSPQKQPLSTFSIDVDAASYSNVRRFIRNGQLPPQDAVRIEELINYFNYAYPQPGGDDPVAIHTEAAPSPWNPQNKLVRIGLQARKIPADRLPACNFVFLIDVSGSMAAPNKLPLLQSSLRMLTGQLRPQDRVTLITYAGAAGTVLPATPGSEQRKIKTAIDALRAGGSTNGGAGIQLAYQAARAQFRENGNNRVILATDGDFNVGISSDAELERMIEKERESGIFLTVLGFGMGNYKDSKMEKLADRGNGNYAYIDDLGEARRVLLHEFGGTLFTVARDVKLQVEFNPARVQGYRLIGYEDRLLNDEDFNNDKKDAGEIGSGQVVTALYEIIPAGIRSPLMDSVDNLKYQRTLPLPAQQGNELMTVKLRYKEPQGGKSRLLSRAVQDTGTPLQRTSSGFRFAAAVAEFGLLLRQSDFRGQANYGSVLELAGQALGDDPEGYRHAFIDLVKNAQQLTHDGPENTPETENSAFIPRNHIFPLSIKEIKP